MSEKHEYSKKEKCLEDMTLARKLWGNKDTTKSQYEAMEFCLGLILLYCPSEVVPLVTSMLNESEIRKVHFLLNIW